MGEATFGNKFNRKTVSVYFSNKTKHKCNTYNKYGNETSNGSIPIFIERCFSNKQAVKDEITQP